MKESAEQRQFFDVTKESERAGGKEKVRREKTLDGL